MLPDGDGRSFLEAPSGQRNLEHPGHRSDRPKPRYRIESDSLDLGADDDYGHEADSIFRGTRGPLPRRVCAGSLATQSTHDRDRHWRSDLSTRCRPAPFRSAVRRNSLAQSRDLRLSGSCSLNAPGQIFLQARSWPTGLFSYDDDVSENAIEVYVGRLRRHLKGSGVSITTVRGLGYKLEQL